MESPADITWNGYSLAERDWRWQRVRNGAAKAGFDCTFVPLCVDGRNLHLSLEQARGTRSDCRFLTQLENGAVIMPTDGRKPIIISDQETGNDWVPECSALASVFPVSDADFTLTGEHFTASSTILPTQRSCSGCPMQPSRTRQTS